MEQRNKAAKKVMEANDKRELEQGRNSPNMVWSEDGIFSATDVAQEQHHPLSAS